MLDMGEIGWMDGWIIFILIWLKNQWRSFRMLVMSLIRKSIVHFLTLLACKSILVCMGHRPVAQYHQCTVSGTDCTGHTFGVRLERAYKSKWRD